MYRNLGAGYFAAQVGSFHSIGAACRYLLMYELQLIRDTRSAQTADFTHAIAVTTIGMVFWVREKILLLLYKVIGREE